MIFMMGGYRMGLIEELSLFIERWQSDRRNHTLPMLARLSGVSYPTVRRIAQRETVPELGSVINILSIVASVEETKTFLQKHNAVLAKVLDSSLYSGEPLKGLAEIDNFTLQDFLVIALAATQDGTDQKEILFRAGKLGADSIEKLMSAGVIERSGDRIVTIAQNVRTIGDERVLKSIALLCEAFDYKQINSRGSLFRFKSEGLSKEAVLQIYKILYEASNQIQQIMDDEKNRGEYVLGVGMVSTFIKFPEGEPNL
ncbi:MAG: hypothetical protein EOP48_03850 [Sphingobacteriales bacterium]|nr:MAG: hypothetical protein EOP48_03850 [Sphingobacteriales bacterium]